MNSSTEQKQASSEYRANLEVLMQIPLFGGLPPEPLKVLTYLCNRETFKEGEIICPQGEVDFNAYLIIEGKICSVLKNGEEAPIAEFGEGEFIGALGLFGENKRLFTLKAASKVVCLTLSSEKFRRTLAQFPEIGLKIFERIVKRIFEWESGVISEHALKCAQCQRLMGVTLI